MGLLDWRFTWFYGNLVTSQRANSWTLLRRLLAHGHGPWMIARDFNEILFSYEKDGVNAWCRVQMEAFQSVVQDCELVDLGYSGPKYTWSNNRSSRLVWERLDRVLANCAWVNGFPVARVFHLVRASSNHSPILVDVLDQRAR
ncbi:hypothetical protein LOK49_LG05G00313 [Camellia lanceoleosa]|uniref:Uncharacterized protein n=1 Tax=Camellia lanceoleosa TaxID=1840588 RepID=A0ACC0HN41_9ERIC|nr:hypothetical protein LOK49_LG05G00313 [Camellia lanceoleosa]